MDKILRYILLISATISIFSCAKDETEKSNTESKTSTSTPVYTTYDGLVMAGYQGWYGAEDDGMGLGWDHYTGTNNSFEPGLGKITIEFWPDMREYKKKYLTPFVFEDGTGAYLYSSTDYETTDLHFQWMEEYGIDGIFLQRFLNPVLSSEVKKAKRTKVTDNVARAAIKYNRAWCIMYDLSGCDSSSIAQLTDDIAEQESIYQFSDPSVCPTYLHHNGRPLLALWGIGFTDDRDYDCADVLAAVKQIKAEGRYSLLLGIPYKWLKNSNEDELWDILELGDIILPWSGGRYTAETYETISDYYMLDDIAWCAEKGIDYVPVVFPGKSGGNIDSDYDRYCHSPRNKGDFFWAQAYKSYSLGLKSLYLAMFDESDEGTVYLKCLNTADVPLNGDGTFAGYEDGLETDHYLWLAGEAAKMFRGESGYSANRPIRDSENN